MPLETSFRARRLPMTSLIDVIFLLLLFFMLSTSFSRFGEIELTAGGAGPSTSPNTRPKILTLSPERLLLNGNPVELAGLGADLDAAEGPLLVTMRGEVTTQRLTDLLNALKAIPGLDIRVLD